MMARMTIVNQTVRVYMPGMVLRGGGSAGESQNHSGA